MSRVSLLEGRWTMTARMDVRFRRPVALDQRVRAMGEKVRVAHGFPEARGRVELSYGRLAADATGTYAFVTDEALAKMSAPYPQLARGWMVAGDGPAGAHRR